MAAQQSPTGPLTHQQHYPAAVHAQPNGAMAIPQQQPQPQGPPPPQQHKTAAQWLSALNEQAWFGLAHLSEIMGDLDGASQTYERVLNFNPRSVQAMLNISSILRTKDQYAPAVEYLKRILQIEPGEGEVWSSLGHCYLMMDDLQQAYSAYQQALYHLPDPKEPKLWYGIGILYDRYGSLEHAEEAFSQVMRMEPNFEKANEIYFRLGIIYKQQQKFNQSLDCFRYIVTDPPKPLSEEDIWFQIGHVHEQQKDYDNAKMAYTRVLDRDPNHAKVLQQLGWLHHQQSTEFSSQEQAIEYLAQSVASDQNDAQSWYLLGRCYMSQQKYPKAYEAYQQAVYRDGRNPTFWCSIGVLYYQINQYRDALDAYSRAIRLNPNISEVWYDLGTLYESCNNQTSDALDAYQRAAELDPSNVHIKARLALLKGQPTHGLPNPANAPLVQDVHPQAYQPGALGGPPGPQWHTHAQNPQPPGAAPPPLAAGNGWGSGRVAEPQNPQMQPQPLNPYDQRDRMPQPQQAPPQQQQQMPPRQPSPSRQDMRGYREPQRPPPPAHRGLSPSPKGQQSIPASYQPPMHHQPPPHLAHVGHQGPLQQAAPNGPPYGAPASAVPPHAPGSVQGPSSQGSMPPYARQPSPRQDLRPLVHNPAPSPGGSYPRTPYEHHPNPATPNIASGAPAPSSAQYAADAAARERDDGPGGAMAHKRPRDWGDEQYEMSAPKRLSTEEGRSRLDEIKMHRPSPPRKMATPPIHSPSELRRLDEGRPPSTYHPSDAAHHPPALPSMQSITGQTPQPQQQQQQHQPPPPPSSAPPQEDSRAQPPPPTTQSSQSQNPAVYEPAARKMDMDENYDDSGDDDKRSATKQESSRSSPKGAVNGGGAGPSVVEQQA